MSRYLQHPLAAPAAVLAGLMVVLGVAQFTLPTKAGVVTAPQTSREPVGEATVVCPEPSGGRIAVATAPGGDGTGQAVVRTVGDPGRRLGKVAQRGSVWTETLTGGAPAVIVNAQSSMAASLEVEQTSNTGTGAGEGLSGMRCPQPDTSFWFVGDGVGLGRATVLHLVNTDETPASVSVDVYGPDGPVTSAAANGISVAPHSRTSIQLGALAPKPSITALHVRSETGPVVAALHTRAERGEQALGADWVPQTAEPRRKLLIPGIPAGAGPRKLRLVAPGDDTARVQVQAVTTEGTYAPEGKQSVTVQPGAVTELDLSKALSQRAAAVRLTADVPVTASMVIGSGDGLAYSAAVPALSGGAVVADNGPGGGVTSTLLLSAPMKTAAARVTLFGAEGTAEGSEIVRIPSARTVPVELSPPPSVQGNYAVVVSPVEGSGPLYGARVLEQEAGGKLTVLPLQTSEGWVRVPDADESLGSVITGG